VAGAGSGKTRVLTIASPLIRNGGVSPFEIWLTFTNKAADEMKQRVAALVRSIARRCGCRRSTACVRILRRDGKALGFPSSFTIYDQAGGAPHRLRPRDLNLDSSASHPARCTPPSARPRTTGSMSRPTQPKPR
jgi:DNA helicase-2/ATP-dependent DNA helicase PcrA